MLKRLIIIMLLLTPTALPATSIACQMMISHLGHLTSNQSEHETMNCCAADSAGHCPMMSEAAASSQVAQETSSDSVSVDLCDCGLSNSSVPPGLPSERLTANSIRVAPDVLAVIAHQTIQTLAPSRRIVPTPSPPAHLNQTCLRI
jgi:hypothetical protein